MLQAGENLQGRCSMKRGNDRWGKTGFGWGGDCGCPSGAKGKDVPGLTRCRIVRQQEPFGEEPPGVTAEYVARISVF